MQPNWQPLERKLGASQCAGFMFMGRREGINFYKHGISRRYLLLDDSGRAYEMRDQQGLAEIPFEEALARVEQPLIALGESLDTPYDAKYITRKAQALRAADIEMVRIIVDHNEGEV